MVIINNSFEFEVYPLDTNISISERLASDMNSIPRYIYYPGLEPVDMLIEKLRKEENIQLGDLLEDMKTQELSQISSMIESLGNITFFFNESLDIVNDIIAPSIAYNLSLSKASQEERRALLLLLSTQIIQGPVVRLWNIRQITRSNIEKEIETNKAKVKETQILVTTKGLEHTKFTRQEVSLQLEFDFNGLNLLEIFDKIKVTPYVPFASVNDLYKILSNFTPDADWEAHEGHIYLKFLVSPLSAVDQEFLDAVLIVEGDNGKEIGTLETELIQIKRGMNEKIFEKHLRDIFGERLPLKILNTRIMKDKGKFFYPLGDHLLDMYVLGDLVLNDALFKQYLAIDEHEAATKGKRRTIYIHYFGGSTEKNVRANLTVYKTRYTDEVHKLYNYQVGEYYLNVLVSDVKSEEALSEFMIVFGKLLAIYNEKAPKIIKIYQELLPPGTFPSTYLSRAAPVKRKKKTIPLSKQAPEVFVAGYPTKCTHQPSIISAEEAKAEKRDVMHYPKTDSEGFPQRWYVCDNNSRYPYPGLRTNVLSNNDVVPYLPCCFKTKQDLGPNVSTQGKLIKLYGHYFYDLPLLDYTGTDQQKLLSRDIFLNPLQPGRLPEPLQKMLDLVVYRSSWTFIRSGMFDTKTSFLECVLEAFQSYNGKDPKLRAKASRIRKLLEYESPEAINAQDALDKALKTKSKRDLIIQAKAKLWGAKKTERIEFLNKFRQKLSTPENATGCSQSMYDYSEEEIMDTIRNPDIYFDPRLVTNLLEKYFGCKIIIFSRVIPGSRDHEYLGRSTTAMVLPRHIQGYYNTVQTNAPTILIYERAGRGSEQKEYPRCELISHWNNNDQNIMIHQSTSKLSIEMNILYERLRESYSLNCKILQTIFPIKSLIKVGINLTHQEIDSYGKCRALIFEYEGKEGSMLITPIQPLLLPRYSSNKVTPRLPKEIVLRIFKKLGTKIEKETITHHYVSAYSGKIGNVPFSLPFQEENDGVTPSGTLSVEEDLISRDQTKSKLRSYTRDKRIARYMVEYVRWLYSKFLHDLNIDHSVKSIQRFIKNNIIVDPNYEYTHIAKNFKMDSGLTKEGKLYVKSEETLKRLIYTLQVYSMQHPIKLKQYRLHTSISEYYLNVGDFIRYRSQVLLQGDNAVLKWIRERDQDYFLHNGVISPSERLNDLKDYIDDLSIQLSTLSKSTEPEQKKLLVNSINEVRKEYSKLYESTVGSPHFFKNSLVGNNKMYLYQASTGFSQALTICDTWNRSRDTRGLGINDAQSINKDKEEAIFGRRFYTLFLSKS